MNDTPNWQLYLLARLPRPVALLCILMIDFAWRVAPYVLAILAFSLSTAFWTHIGMRLTWNLPLTVIFGLWGFCFPAIVLWMYEQYRALDKRTPRREKKGDDDE